MTKKNLVSKSETPKCKLKKSLILTICYHSESRKQGEMTVPDVYGITLGM